MNLSEKYADRKKQSCEIMKMFVSGEGEAQPRKLKKLKPGDDKACDLPTV